MPEEITGAQTITAIMGEKLAPSLPKTFKTYRDIAKHPTVFLVRLLSTAAISSGSWTVEKRDDDVDDEMVGFIERMFLPLRELLYTDALNNGTDYGFAGFEKVFRLDKSGPQTRVVLSKLKSLLVDMTTILVIQETGQFAGFEQKRAQVRLELPNAFLIPFRVEGTMWYGNSLLENIRPIFEKWCASDAGAARYDKRIAGAHWVVTYPFGHAIIGGVKTENGEIAKTLLAALQSSGGVTVPRTTANTIEELNADKGDLLSWKIELISDKSPRQPSFVDRESYLDKLMVRGLGWPERAMLEGEFGTKAEAGTHKDLALLGAERTDRHITRLTNWHCVDQILELNFGSDARGAVKLVATPLIDSKLSAAMKVYEKLLSDSSIVMDESEQINMRTLREKIGIMTDPDAPDPVVRRVEPDDDPERKRAKSGGVGKISGPVGGDPGEVDSVTGGKTT